MKKHTDYEIIDCKNYGLVPFWADSELFAVWSEPNFNKQHDLISKVSEAVKKCDIFIFQHYKNEVSRPVELTTEYLVDINPNCLAICLPSFWYTGYLGVPGMNPVIYELYTKLNYSAETILDFLQTSTNEFIHQMIAHEHHNSITELEKRRDNESQKYHNLIDCINYIINNFDKKILTYNHSHPSIWYFNFLIEKLHTGFKLNINELLNETSLLPGADHNICYHDLYYFTDYFKNINDYDIHNNFFSTKLNLKVIEEHIQHIKNSKAAT